MDVFSWSLPFVAEKISKMFQDILEKTETKGKINLEEVEEDVNIEEMIEERKKKNINILKKKIKFVSKIAKMQKVLREENENIFKIKVILFKF